MITEEQAKEMWCPMVRVGDNEFLHTNRGAVENKAFSIHTGCIGSRCMAWRWSSESAFGSYNGEHETEWSITGWGDIDNMRACNPKVNFRIERYGHCGLAGRPS